MKSYLKFDSLVFHVNSTWLEQLICASLRQSWGGKVISLPVSVVVLFEVQKWIQVNLFTISTLCRNLLQGFWTENHQDSALPLEQKRWLGWTSARVRHKLNVMVQNTFTNNFSGVLLYVSVRKHLSVFLVAGYLHGRCIYEKPWLLLQLQPQVQYPVCTALWGKLSL